MIRVLLSGCMGKMGHMLVEVIGAAPDMTVCLGVDSAVTPGTVSPYSFPVVASFDKADAEPDVIVDFSRPAALESLLDFAEARRTAVVLATTGYSDEQKARIDAAAARIPVFYSANMSPGVNLLCALVKKAAAFLGEDYDIEIVEAHHNKKIDAPSGTALMLAESAMSATSAATWTHCGRSGKNCPRQPGEIGIHAIRGGTVVGEHSVLFLGDNEVIELKHSAQSRAVFARGAVRAARFIVGVPAGKYDMSDLIGKD